MKLQIQIDSRMYEVEVEVAEEDYPSPPQDNQPAPAAATIQSTVLRTPPKPGASESGVDESKLCRSPLAGTVIRVPVVPGQDLEVNDLIIMLEAMKMETAVTAPVSGKLKAVLVVSGEAVRANQVLVEFH